MDQHRPQPIAAARLAEARRFGPLVEPHRAALARGPNLPDDLAQALRQTGVLELWFPAELGGAELPPADVMRVVEALAAMTARSRGARRLRSRVHASRDWWTRTRHARSSANTALALAAACQEGLPHVCQVVGACPGAGAGPASFVTANSCSRSASSRRVRPMPTRRRRRHQCAA